MEKQNNNFLLYHYFPIKYIDSVKLNGIISPEYALNVLKDIPLFLEMTNHYRDRCILWNPKLKNKNPIELTIDEIIDSINLFRESNRGVGFIYAFKFPIIPYQYKALDNFIEDKAVAIFDLNELIKEEQIDFIYYGENLNKTYYENINPKNYFSDSLKNNKKFIAKLSPPHPGILTKSGIILNKYLQIKNKYLF